MRRRYLQAMLAGAALAWTATGPADAAQRIEQTAQTSFDGKSYASTHIWTVDGDKFKLSVQTPRGEATYLFNGRTFYVCGRLDDGDRAFLSKNHLQGDKLMARFKNGACQAVPNNFMARFFLAQSLAAESLDRSDGMEVTLTVGGYKASATGRQEQAAGKTCSVVERSYTLKKSTDAGAYATQTDDVLCLAPEPDWRSGLWTEVAKAVLRQPGGAVLMAQLKKDRDGVRGFPLQLASKFRLTLPDGKTRLGDVKLVLRSVQNTVADATTFKLPAGYQLFAPESGDIPEFVAGSPPAGKPARGGASGNSNEGSAAEQLLQSAQSVFLCAISGSLGCTVAD